ncbi:MAG: IMPACT family protein [Rubricoccaceae bacterium]
MTARPGAATQAAPGADRYRALAAAARAEPPKTKGSRFIGEAYPVTSEEEAMAVLAAVRRREHAATHHVWAYRLGPAGDRQRASDDGEPAGSSGPPVLREIAGRGLTDTLVVVTRYYGGTKLGTGGLARAYAEAAARALDAAPAEWRVVRVPVPVRFGFADTAAVLRALALAGAEAGETVYSADGASLRALVPRSRVAALGRALAEATAGRVRVEARAAGED